MNKNSWTLLFPEHVRARIAIIVDLHVHCTSVDAILVVAIGQCDDDVLIWNALHVTPVSDVRAFIYLLMNRLRAILRSGVRIDVETVL